MSAQVLLNALSGVGARLAMMAVGFLLTPFIVHTLGVGQYGLWSVIGSLAGYLGLLDFGLGGAFVKFITEYVEQERHDAARQVVSFGMLFYAAFGLALAIPIVLLAPALVHLFKMPASQMPAAAHVFQALFVLLALSLVVGLPGAAVVSMQRMDLASRNNVLGYVAYVIATVVLLRRGYGIAGVIAAGYVQLIVTAGLQYVTARRLFGPLFHNPLRFERAVIGRLFAFGGWTQLTSLLTIVSLDVGRFVAAGTVGVVSVTYYELGSKLAFFSKSMPSYFLDAIMPAAAAADAHGDGAALDRMYRLGTLYAMFATFGIGGFLVGASDPVMRVWMGQTYPYVALVIFGLTIGYCASSLTGVGTTVFRAAGIPKYEAYFTAISAAANLIATVLLAPRIGLTGVVAGTAVGWIAGSVYFSIVYHRVRAVAWWPTVGAPAARLAAAAVCATALLSAAVHAPFAQPAFGSRVGGLLALGAAAALYGALYLGLAWLAGAADYDESRLAERLVHRLRAGGAPAAVSS